MAFEISKWSTVNQDPLRPHYFSLPYGFVQSPVLATLVLDRCLMGRKIREINAGGIALSVYMDDFILSGNDEAQLRTAMDELHVAAAASNFRFNPTKAVGPAPLIRAFNIDLSHGQTRICDARMAEFVDAITLGIPEKTLGILGYVGTVSADQQRELEALA